MSTKNIGNIFSKLTIDDARDFVEKYLRQIVYIVVLILTIAFITIFTINKRANQQKQLMIDYYEAINYIKSDDKKAMEMLEKIYNLKKADNNLKTIAGLRLADLLVLNNKNNEAIAIYKNIYALKGNELFLKNLSGLTAASLMINQNNPDNYSEIEKILGELSNIKDPISILAEEQKGMFEIQKGNVEDGLAILQNLLNRDIDEDTKARIETVIKLYK